MYQHDPRHVDVLVKDFGLEQGNSVQTPAAHDVTEEEPELLDQVQHSKYRSQVGRCLFFRQDRVDITYIEACQNPTQQSLAKLIMLVRYLKRERQRGQIFSYGRLVQEVTTDVASDWAGCKAIRKSRVDHVRQTHTESVHAQAENHCNKQCRSRALCCSFGSV